MRPTNMVTGGLAIASIGLLFVDWVSSQTSLVLACLALVIFAFGAARPGRKG